MERADLNNIVITCLLIMFLAMAIAYIRYVYNLKYMDETKEQAFKDLNRLMVPVIALSCFFISTYFVALLVQRGNFPYIGIQFLILVAIVFTILNNTVLSPENIRKYIRGKKFTNIGILMALGVGAVVFGFLDNFGLKLGADALDTNFLNLFLGPFSVDTRFKSYDKNIGENIARLNYWSGEKWFSLINQTLRFEKEFRRLKNVNGFDAFLEDLDYFLDKNQGGGALKIPEAILKQGDPMVKDYVRNIKDKFFLIDGSKNMMGNAFSDAVGAILGAALANLLIYMTAYDGIITGDDTVDESWLTKNMNRIMPFVEAVFITIGCLIPVFLNIAMTRSDYNKNNLYSWMALGGISLIVLVVIYFSVKGVRPMSEDEKKRALKKTLIDLEDRLDIKDTELKSTLENLQANL